MKIYELLDSPDKWIKGFAAIDKDGRSVYPQDREAACWCLVGALAKCYIPNGEFDDNYLVYCQHEQKLSSAIRKKGYVLVTNFNDDPDTTYEDVIRICKELDI